jgi:hypothetical protein
MEDEGRVTRGDICTTGVVVWDAELMSKPRDHPQWEVCASSADDKPAAAERPHHSGVPLTMPGECQPGDRDD